ncbi:MAG: hypothetical protein EOP93_25270, partial [Lysobacteraceae bacterium]
MPMRWTVGTKIAAGFGLALCIFLAVGAISYRSTAQLIDASAQRQMSYDTLDALSDTRLAVRSIAIAVRSYLLSGEDGHFDALREAQRSLDAPLRELRTLVSDDPAQARRVEEVSRLLREYQTGMTAIAEIRRTRGAAPATQLFLADETRQQQAELARVLRELQTVEDAELVERSARTDAEIRIAQTTIVFGNLIAFVLAVLAGHFITRNIAGALKSLTATAERVTA